MDAAKYNMGENWRMPTKKDFEELINNCKWEKYYKNGLYGFKVTGPSGKSIYLPGDKRSEFYNLYHSNSAIPRTGSMDDDRYAYALLVSPSNYKIDKITRITALMIRGVTKSKPAGIIDVEIDNNQHQKLRVENGSIVGLDNIKVFSINGVQMINKNLPKGIYIVKSANYITKIHVF
ncbi:MAG: hypothetical protein NC043_07385 [Muribaculaceae bacterium]|nr:hypothetical protein [Muribaculaceae bacterium]